MDWPQTKNNKKTKQIEEFIKDKNINVLCINKHSLNLQKLSAHEGWQARFKSQKTHTLAALNIHSTNKGKRIYGGTAHITSSFLSPRVKDYRAKIQQAWVDGPGYKLKAKGQQP